MTSNEKTTAFGFMVRQQVGIRRSDSGRSSTGAHVFFFTSYEQALELLSNSEPAPGQSWEIEAVEVTVSVGVGV